MKHVRDVMEAPPLAVAPETPVQELARLLLDRQVDGAAVIEAGELIGVVTAMDLIFQEKRVHLPTVFFFLEAVVPGGQARTESELRKISGATVAEIMSRDPVTVTPATPLDEAAALMVERHLSMLPVVEGQQLVGSVTKTAMLRAAFAEPRLSRR